MRVSREKAAENRERIIDAAGTLFRARGFAGIGVADIMKAAELTHGGFYGHFASKDDLAAAYVQQRSDLTLARQIGAASSVAGPFAAKVAALFDAVERSATQAGWTGCPFIRTAGEFVDEPRHKAVRYASLHKKSLEAWFQVELVKEGYAGHQRLARQLMVLVDGAVRSPSMNSCTPSFRLTTRWRSKRTWNSAPPISFSTCSSGAS